MRRRKRSGIPKPGLSFEHAVAEMQRRLDPASTVEHNVVLTDRLGIPRQFDVVLRGKVGGHDVLGVIECKDLERRVGTPEVDAFVTKSHDVRANLKLLVSRRGFSKPAMRLAGDHGIGLLSLLKTDVGAHGVAAAWRAYASIYHWDRLALQIELPDGALGTIGEPMKDLAVRGQRIYDWLIHLLFTQFGHLREPGVHKFVLRAKNPLVATTADGSVELTALHCDAHRERSFRTKLLHWAGDGLVDWQKNQLHLPAYGSLSTQVSSPLAPDWEDYAATELPPIHDPPPIVDVRIEAFTASPLTLPIVQDLHDVFEVEHLPPPI